MGQHLNIVIRLYNQIIRFAKIVSHTRRNMSEICGKSKFPVSVFYKVTDIIRTVMGNFERSNLKIPNLKRNFLTDRMTCRINLFGHAIAAIHSGKNFLCRIYRNKIFFTQTTCRLYMVGMVMSDTQTDNIFKRDIMFF